MPKKMRAKKQIREELHARALASGKKPFDIRAYEARKKPEGADELLTAIRELREWDREFESKRRRDP